MFIDIIKGLLSIFINPFFYLLILISFLGAFQRVKRERLSFGIKVYGAANVVFTNLIPGLLVGMFATAVLIGFGVALAPGVFILFMGFYMLLILVLQFRLASPAVAFALTILVSMLLPDWTTHMVWLNHLIDGIQNTGLPSLGSFLVVILLSECLLTIIWGSKLPSPRLINSRRGKKVGAYEVSHYWVVPMVFLVPGGPVGLDIGWWPLASGDSFSFLLFPVGIGLQQLIVHTLPEQAVKRTGVLMGLATLITTFTVVIGIVFGFHILIACAAGFAFIFHLLLVYYHHYERENQPFYFVDEGNGLRVVGIVPGSPAEKMAVKIGEVVHKVNGVPIQSEEEFYHALQINAAYCQLEMIDYQNERRFVRRTIYQDDWHHIGLLFLEPSRRVKSA